MLHTGRILALAFVVAIIAALFSYIKFDYGVTDWKIVYSLALLFPLGWLLGKRYDLLKHLSEIDELTELYNRRFIQELFPKLSNLSNKKGETLIVVLADVDNFKFINDTYDHETGDNQLRHLSKVLTKITRKSGFVVRWGGDEFLVVLPRASESMAEQFIERLDKELGDGKFYRELIVPISVSVGYAVYPGEGNNLSELLRIADKRMYLHKFERM